MSLRDEIQSRQHAALKAGETAAVSTLRLLWSAIRNEEINVQHPLADAEVQAVAARQVKQLADALADYQKGGRADLAAPAKAEIELLSAYLPAQLSADELNALAARVVGELGAKGSADIGRVMAAVMKEVKGRADGNQVRAIVARLLA